MLSDEDRNAIEAERLLAVLRHAPAALSVMILNAILVAIVLTPDGNRAAVMLWSGAVILIAGARWVFARLMIPRLEQPNPPAAEARLMSMLGTCASGLLWGLCASLLFPHDQTQQIILTLIIAGMGAGSITVNGADLPTVGAFVVPSVVPLAVSFLAEGRQWWVAALLILFFAIVLMLVAVRAHRMFGRQLHLRLALNRERRKLLAASHRLRVETAQRQAAEDTLRQAQKMDAIGHLTGGIAHDFNNMLQVILGNLQLIRRAGAGNPRVIGYARAAEKAAKRGSELTNTLLTFARRQSLTAQAVSANALLREFEPVLRRALTSGISFNLALDPAVPLCTADPAYFQSAVLNLVINARDALSADGTLSGGTGLGGSTGLGSTIAISKISISTGTDELSATDLAGNSDAQPGRFVRVRVQDSGCGMSAETVARAFEPFFTTKQVGKGTGLGLSQVFGFVRQSGGHIALSSTQGAGTTVTLWLPASPALHGADPAHPEARFQPA